MRRKRHCIPDGLTLTEDDNQSPTLHTENYLTQIPLIIPALMSPVKCEIKTHMRPGLATRITRDSHFLENILSPKSTWVSETLKLIQGLQKHTLTHFCPQSTRSATIVTSINTHLNAPKYSKHIPQSTNRARAQHALTTQLATAASQTLKTTVSSRLLGPRT